jgi:hypothetical protein
VSNPELYIKIEAQLGWGSPTESEDEKAKRHQAQHEVDAMARDLEKAVKEIMEVMIFHRKRVQGF